MLERFNYNNFKNLAINSTNYACEIAKAATLGAIAGSAVSLIEPTFVSNLPARVVDVMSKTNNTAVTYLKNNLDASYIIAPVVFEATKPLLSLVGRMLLQKNTKELWKQSPLAGVTLTAAAVAVPLYIAGSVSMRVGYPLTLSELLIKGCVLPLLTKGIAFNLLDSTFPKPTEEKEAVTVQEIPESAA